jgi:hypothetical protein
MQVTIWNGQHFSYASEEEAIALQSKGLAQVFKGNTWEPLGRQLHSYEFPFEAKKNKAVEVKETKEEVAAEYETKEMVAAAPKRKTKATKTVEGDK